MGRVAHAAHDALRLINLVSCSIDIFLHSLTLKEANQKVAEVRLGQLTLLVATALDALYNLYGVHHAIENPRASLRTRPLMLSLVQSERVRL